MDSLPELFSDFNGYYVALIIVTIVTIAIGIALSFFFVFIPASRAERTFDNLESRGTQAISNVTNFINNATNITNEVEEDICRSLIYSVNKLFGQPGIPIGNGGCIAPKYCINTNPLIPTACKKYINPADIAPCCGPPCTCINGCGPS